MAVHPVGHPSSEDLTARARIRDAAVGLFAERGVDGTTIRDIAKAADVSPGLVRHHFGSKEALRDACDAHVLDRIVRIKEQAVLEGRLANPGFLSSVHPTILLYYRYLSRALVDGSRSAAAMFDEMVELTEQWLARHNPGLSADPRAYAAVLVAMQAGLLAMHDHLSRALGADIFGPEGNVRMAEALVDFYSHPLVSPELAAQAHAAYQGLRARQDPRHDQG
jgi:TetR/AcrR family transcriptional regulator, regulator of cefoperazone and chloramphenicol sensitivity